MKHVQLMKHISSLYNSYQIGFIRGHDYLTTAQIKHLEKIVNTGEEDNTIIRTYEEKFIKHCGGGYGISFASGRMAFFVFLKSLGIGKGDEVIIPALTCSVMVNAVWRTGAVPVFADIDPNTFGSNVSATEQKITTKTKVIVAQHTFGIPCDVDKIVSLAKKNNCYVVEDCALTFDSSLDGRKVGTFGDAAIFSTDHSKPINTIIGGFLFTKHKDVFECLKFFEVESLSRFHQKTLFKQVLSEKKYYGPFWYPRKYISTFVSKIISQVTGNSRQNAFLESDYGKDIENGGYPYPARLPAISAQLGIYELDRWNEEKERRKMILRKYIDIFILHSLQDILPSAYFDSRRDISPLRLIFSSEITDYLVNGFKRSLDVEWIWWRLEGPIACSPDGLEALGYGPGNAPISEKLCKKIFQLPCNIRQGWENILYKKLNRLLSRCA